jgi:argininosuccinate lyase
LLKGLPLAYDRDLQEDKELVFRSVRRTRDALVGAIHLIRALEFDERRMSAAAAESATWATDLAERLVARGVPFREAHESLGRLVAELEGSSRSLNDLGADELRDFHPLLEARDVEVADPLQSVQARRGPGGTAPSAVEKQIENLRDLADGLLR